MFAMMIGYHRVWEQGKESESKRLKIHYYSLLHSFHCGMEESIRESIIAMTGSDCRKHRDIFFMFNEANQYYENLFFPKDHHYIRC